MASEPGWKRRVLLTWSSSLRRMNSDSWLNVDGDGDEDRVSRRTGGLQWREKLDDAPGFGQAHFIPIEGRVHLSRFGDLDGDGDDDLLLRVVGSEDVATVFLESHDNGRRFESHQLSFEF